MSDLTLAVARGLALRDNDYGTDCTMVLLDDLTSLPRGVMPGMVVVYADEPDVPVSVTADFKRFTPRPVQTDQPFTITTFTSEIDGLPVIQIDTTGPARFRVNLNDGDLVEVSDGGDNVYLPEHFREFHTPEEN